MANFNDLLLIKNPIHFKVEGKNVRFLCYDHRCSFFYKHKLFLLTINLVYVFAK